MNVDDLIQYVSQETLLIGMQLKARAFLLLQMRYIDLMSECNKMQFEELCLDHKLLELNHIISNCSIDWDKPEYWDYGLYGACQGDHQHLAELMIQKGAIDFNASMCGATKGAHQHLIELMIQKGANNWNWALYGACIGGHKHLAEWFILKGANDWNWGLYGVCRGVSVTQYLAEWMIEKGADDWDRGLYGACQGGNRNFARLMIEKGAYRSTKCLKLWPDI